MAPKLVDAINWNPSTAGLTRYPCPVTGKRIIGVSFGSSQPLTNTVTIRIFANNKQIFPLIGFVNIGPTYESMTQVIPVNILLEGPPYNVEVESSGVPGEAGWAQVVITSTDSPDDPIEVIGTNFSRIAALLGG